MQGAKCIALNKPPWALETLAFRSLAAKFLSNTPHIEHPAAPPSNPPSAPRRTSLHLLQQASGGRGMGQGQGLRGLRSGFGFGVGKQQTEIITGSVGKHRVTWDYEAARAATAWQHWWRELFSVLACNAIYCHCYSPSYGCGIWKSSSLTDCSASSAAPHLQAVQHIL